MMKQHWAKSWFFENRKLCKIIHKKEDSKKVNSQKDTEILQRLNIYDLVNKFMPVQLKIHKKQIHS